MPKIRVKRKKRRGSFLSRYNFAQAGRDTINTGLNTIKRIDPSLIENSKKKLARLLKRELHKYQGRMEKNQEESAQLS